MKYFPEMLDADMVAAVFKAVSHAIEVAHKKSCAALGCEAR